MDIEEGIAVGAEVLSAATRIISAVIDLVGSDKAQELLSEEAIRRAETLADTAENAKFPP